MRKRDQPISSWPEHCADWLRVQGVLKPQTGPQLLIGVPRRGQAEHLQLALAERLDQRRRTKGER